MNLGRGAFEAMAHVVSLVHRSLEGAQDTRGHCPLLAAYVYYAFRLPGTEPSLPGGECRWETLGHKKYLGGKHPKQREGMCKGPEATGLGWFIQGIGERERELCTSAPGLWSL